MAWKALGAVGSYVYGGAESADETRGMKEGRKVGLELPRRVGLEGKGAGPDDGWKNVRRVAVIGVHGWFPAKMFNSCVMICCARGIVADETESLAIRRAPQSSSPV